MVIQKCSVCGSKMQALFVTLFCPKDCDKKKPVPWADFPNVSWKWVLVKPGEFFPEDARWGWWLPNGEKKWIHQTLIEFRDEGVKWPGWVIGSPERKSKLDCYALAFK